MISLQILPGAFKTSEIEVISVDHAHVNVGNNFQIDVEGNGIYKLFDDGYIIGPGYQFNDEETILNLNCFNTKP
jgi:hypothetical protein